MQNLRIVRWYFLWIIWLPSAVFASDERLILNAKIGGEAVRLAIDTGAQVPLIILRPAAKRLSLKTEEEKGKTTAVFTLEIAGNKFANSQALIIDSIPFPDIDGLCGWPALLGRVLRVQWENMSLSVMPSVPKETWSWQVLKLDRRVPIAAAFLHENTEGLLYLDTGNPGGIVLAEPPWNQWVQEKPDLPMALKAGYLPAAGGFFLTELRWSDRFRLGPLTIPRVMVEKNVYKWPRLEAVLGLEALKNFEIVLDLKESRIYLKGRPYARVNFRYNRLGATFLPVSLESNRLVGHVLKNSPAYKAGLRTGDILLKVDNIDMTQWKTDPTIWKREFWEAEPGTQYALEIERNDRKHVFTVVLEEIFNIPRR
jgi:hypothetical protein